MTKGIPFRVIGVDKTSRADVDEVIVALNECNARVKAELHGIVVTSVAAVVESQIAAEGPPVLSSQAVIPVEVETQVVVPPAEASEGSENKLGPQIVNQSTRGSQGPTKAAASSGRRPLADRPQYQAAAPPTWPSKNWHRSPICVSGWACTAISGGLACISWILPAQERLPQIEEVLNHGPRTPALIVEIAAAGCCMAGFAVVGLVLGLIVSVCSGFKAGNSLILASAMIIVAIYASMFRPPTDGAGVVPNRWAIRQLGDLSIDSPLMFKPAQDLMIDASPQARGAFEYGEHYDSTASTDLHIVVQRLRLKVDTPLDLDRLIRKRIDAIASTVADPNPQFDSQVTVVNGHTARRVAYSYAKEGAPQHFDLLAIRSKNQIWVVEVTSSGTTPRATVSRVLDSVKTSAQR